MIKINLLPWREEMRQEKQNAFAQTFAVAMLLTGFILIGIHFYFSQQQNYQFQRNQLLQNEITLLEEQISSVKNLEAKKARLINKIALIYNLQRSRPEIVHIFNEIPRAISDGLFITKLTRVGRDFTFEGKSQSNTLVSDFMNAIENSEWLQTPTLDVIQDKTVVEAKNNDNVKMHDFTLRTKQRNLPDVK